MTTLTASLRDELVARYDAQVDELLRDPAWVALEDGSASRAEQDRLLEALAATHLASPRYLAFVYALCAPAAERDVLHNLQDELGADGASHPELLRALLRGAGLGHRVTTLELLAQERLRRTIAEPLLFGSLRELGLSVMVEVLAFEHLLSRVAGRLGRAFARLRRLEPAALAWFTHHAEADVAHVAQGLLALEAYARWQGIGDVEARAIVDLTLRENVYVRRWLRAGGAA